MEVQKILKTLSELQLLIYNSGCVTSLKQINAKDVIIFMGNTRAGKSTIVNYVLGNELKSEQISKKRYRINHASTEYKGPTIGVESTSETTLPTVWTSNKISGCIVDVPGFDDNRGEAQDIANVYHIKNILTSAKTVKIVLILDINDITNDNIGQCISLFDKIKSIFPNVGTKLNPGITFVLNKDNQETTKDEVRKILQKKILSQPLLKINNRELVQYLEEHQNQIVLIKMPNSERILDNNDEVFYDLVNVIENVSLKVDKSQFGNVHLGLSDKSKAFLYMAHTHLSEHQDFENAFNQSSTLFANKLIHYDQAIGDVSHGNNLINELQALDGRIQEKISTSMNVFESLRALYEIVPENSTIAHGSTIHNKIAFIGFVDQILNINNYETIKGKIKITLTNMKSQVNLKKSNIQGRIEQLQLEEQERLRRIEEERIRIENETLERLRRENEERERVVAALQAQQPKRRKRRLGIFGI